MSDFCKYCGANLDELLGLEKEVLHCIPESKLGCTGGLTGALLRLAEIYNKHVEAPNAQIGESK